MSVSVNDAKTRVGQKCLKMKTFCSVTVLSALVVGSFSSRPTFAAENDGVALAVIYDTSGSMKDPVPDNDGHPSPKYLIANRALIAIANKIQAFTTNTATGSPREIQAGLFIFSGDTASEAVKFGPFNASAFRDWARHFSVPKGNTPLGNSLSVASRAVLDSPLPRKHVLVITDGVNTSGPQPAGVLPRIQQQAEVKRAAISVHFVAFDVNAKVFDSVKKLGATVVGAADEKQLNSQLDFILQHKILLEEEEKPTTK